MLGSSAWSNGSVSPLLEMIVWFATRMRRQAGRRGHFLLIDGSVPDGDPEAEEWLHRVEKWRDPSHGRFLSRKAWEDLAREARLKVLRSALHARKQPDLEWYFETAATPRENREQVLEAVAKASEHVKAVLRLGSEQGKIVWWWPMLTLLASKD